jgi:hypothetical protein
MMVNGQLIGNVLSTSKMVEVAYGAGSSEAQ